jgi:hypothetical protein
MHDETLSVVAMRVSDKDCSSFAIHSCNTAPTPTRFAASLTILNRLRCGFVHFKLRAHFLQARSKRINLLLHLLDLAVTRWN